MVIQKPPACGILGVRKCIIHTNRNSYIRLCRRNSATQEAGGGIDKYKKKFHGISLIGLKKSDVNSSFPGENLVRVDQKYFLTKL
jgi:hypothetical protein